jgi:predicted dehydrogenase
MTIGVGILGFAHGHVHAYCDQWREHPDWDVAVRAGYDHDADRLAAAVKQHGIEVCDTAAALLARKDIDAVVIAAETAYHADLVEQAAAAGKTVILQKPIALTMDEADRIVAAVDRAKVPFTLAWQMRVDPQNMHMKHLVDSSAVGRVYMVRRRHGLPTQSWPWINDSWHTDPQLNRGMWADDASHAIDFLLYLLGEPVSVTAEIATLRTPDVPDDNGIAVYRYADGTIAEVCSSFTCVAAENTTEIIGENGSIIQNYGDVPSCNVPRAKNAVGLKWYIEADKSWRSAALDSPSTHGERIAALAGPFADFLHGRREPIATAGEGRTALCMTLAAHKASDEGRRVSLTELK